MTADRPVALVVGGRGGIGRHIVSALRDQGAHVVVAGRSAQTVPGDYRQLDIGDHAAVAALAAELAAMHGAIDWVVDASNGAVPGLSGRFAQTDPAMFGAFLHARLATLYTLCHAVLPHLSRQRGAIVAMAADSGKVAAPNQTMVGSAAAAIMMFVRTLALEVAREGIRVNCVATSYVTGTPVFEAARAGPLAGRVATAEARAGLGLPDAAEIGRVAAWLCSDAARHLTGQVISVNGGVSAA
ncbi:SDR family NAD(P)-dependent oxidoreductase [Sphingomonas immobilis]|uniref:SDR family oxidoreductase n=1 Tax=Sphingomonas immobilis TaxID=3063997 RepID=A0ABT8ZY56_9SPHN|nr:SDR family oxidoreductase [Sphingomonas sp. CA1-15]MDO7842132.1 SDR family oxidoreductase [Sphingomonas sp. CA1-15]